LFKSTKNAKIKEESDDKCRKKVKEGEQESKPLQKL
jgi:hypothetical protein